MNGNTINKAMGALATGLFVGAVATSNGSMLNTSNDLASVTKDGIEMSEKIENAGKRSNFGTTINGQ